MALHLEPRWSSSSWEVGRNNYCDERDDSDVKETDSDQVMTDEGGSDGGDWWEVLMMG